MPPSSNPISQAGPQTGSKSWEETAFVIASTTTFTALSTAVLYAVVRIFM